MGGVDLLDSGFYDLRPVVRGKQWSWSLVISALNIAFVYSSQIFVMVSEELMPQKTYHR